jgi:hypothetical protein
VKTREQSLKLAGCSVTGGRTVLLELGSVEPDGAGPDCGVPPVDVVQPASTIAVARAAIAIAVTRGALRAFRMALAAFLAFRVAVAALAFPTCRAFRVALGAPVAWTVRRRR